MKEVHLKNMTDEDLRKKSKSSGTLTGLLLVLTLALSFFAIRDYLQEEALEWSSLTIAICTLGGLVVTWGEWRQVNAEIEERKKMA